VRIQANDDCVKLEIIDNGQGFDPQAISDMGGMGLVTMRERAERLGGTLTVLSRLGKGTTIKVNMEVSQ
jgi:signal transduction histidine kinase